VGLCPLRAGAFAPLLLGVAGVLAPLPCQVPSTTQAIPIYSGAERQQDQEASQFGPGSEGRVYRVKAPIEAVVRFYQQRLGAREIRSEDERSGARDAYEGLAVGQTSTPVMLPEFVNLTPAHFAETAGPGEDATRLAAAWRAAYVAKRPPFRPDTWVQSATFEWGARPGADQRAEFYLSVEDVGAWQIRDPEYQHETQIVINVQRTGPPPEQAEEEEAPAAPMAAPAESELGVPIYPGSRFDGRMSASLSAGDNTGNYYVYTSTDTPAQAAAFYERATGKKGQSNPAGVLIVVRGQGLFPDLGVTVQPNGGIYPPAVKTMITIRKKK
jgi:hypothetical protein